jgi:hypothetical protein
LDNLEEVSGIPAPPTCGLMFLSVQRDKYVKGARDIKIGDTITSIALDYLKRYNNDIVYYICRHCPFKCVSVASKQLRKGLYNLHRSPKMLIN